MEAKEQLISNIKEWIKLDTETIEFRAKIKDLNNKKKLLTETLVNVMKSNEIDCFDINDGALILKKSKVKKPINSKTLLTALQKYYIDTPNVAEELTKHIMDSREEQVKELIRRKINK